MISYKLQDASVDVSNLSNQNIMELRVKLDKLDIFDCDQCSETFLSETNLMQHRTGHNNKNPTFICHCGVHVFKQEDLRNHLLEAHPIKEENVEIHTETCTADTLEKTEEPKKPKKVKTKKSTNSETKPKTPRSKGVIRNKLYIKTENGKFSCITCMAEFPTASTATKHYNTNHQMETIDCVICNEKINVKKYKLHLNRKHSRKFVCPVCDKGFGQSSFLRNHFVIHLPKNERPYPCPTCDKRFTQTGSLKVHMKLHSGIKDYICRYCSKAFTDHGNMSNHERTHTKEKPYKCTFCEKAFSDPSAYQRHIRTHTGDKRYSCEFCPKKFTDASGLIAHKLRHSEPKLACDFCHSKFHLYNELKTHIEAVHSKIKNFQCAHCDRRSYSKHNLAAHIFRIHKKEIGMTETKPYCCQHCDKRMGCKYYLRRHIYIAHGEELGLKMNYMICHYCDKVFKIKSDLGNHIFRIHGLEAGMKTKSHPFKCKTCGKSCSTKLDLKRHRENRHGNYTCKMCSQTFASIWLYKKHRKNKACLVNENKQAASLEVSVTIESIKTENYED